MRTMLACVRGIKTEACSGQTERLTTMLLIKRVIVVMATLALRCHAVLPDLWEADQGKLRLSLIGQP